MVAMHNSRSEAQHTGEARGKCQKTWTTEMPKFKLSHHLVAQTCKEDWKEAGEVNT